MTYSFKGLSPPWCMDKIKRAFDDMQESGHLVNFYKLEWTVEDLKWNDIFGCCLCFATEMLKFYPSELFTWED